MQEIEDFLILPLHRTMREKYYCDRIKEIKSPWPDLNQQPFGHCPSCLLVIGGFLALSKQSCLQPNALAIELHGD